MGSSPNSARFARMERLRELLNEKAVTDPTAEQIETCCDQAGLGIISAPEAWFHDEIPGKYGETMLLFRHEHHETTDFILAHVRVDPGWSSGPSWEWKLYVEPYYAQEATG